MKKPPLNRLAFEINWIMIDPKPNKRQKIQELFTFKNFLRHKIYQIKYWYWYKTRKS